MLFKTKEGKYIEIMRNQFITDTAYYTAILQVKDGDVIKNAKDSISEVDRIRRGGHPLTPRGTPPYPH